MFDFAGLGNELNDDIACIDVERFKVPGIGLLFGIATGIKLGLNSNKELYCCEILFTEFERKFKSELLELRSRTGIFDFFSTSGLRLKEFVVRVFFFVLTVFILPIPVEQFDSPESDSVSIDDVVE